VFSYLDLPLLVTIFFSMARRNPISGLLTGAVIGLAQDMLGTTHRPLRNRQNHRRLRRLIAGVKLDVENAGARLLVTLGFYLLHAAAFFTVARGMVNLTLTGAGPAASSPAWPMPSSVSCCIFLLDKFKQRT